MTAGPVDTEAIVVAWLKDYPAITDLAAGVSTELPADLDERPRWLKVYRYPGGGPVDRQTHRLELARIQLDAYGDTKAEAFELGQAAVNGALALAGNTVDPYGFVSDVGVTLGLGWQPDPDTERPRYLCAIEVLAHRLG